MTVSQVFFDNRSYCGEIRREFKKVKILLAFFNDVTTLLLDDQNNIIL